jgi:hypothetical protein
MQKSTGIFLKWMDIKVTVRNGTKIRISIVTLKGSSSRAQGAALGMDAERRISPEGAAQAVPPFQGCCRLITPDPRVSPWAGLHCPSGLASLT